MSIHLDDEDDVLSLQYADADTIRLTVNGVAHDFSRSLITSLSLTTGDGNNQIQVASDVTIGVDLIGGDGDDLLVGGSGSDGLSGGNGSDTLSGNAGSDSLFALDFGKCHYDADSGGGICGPGFDNLSQDSIAGGDGNDTIWAEPGIDTVDGGPGNNTINESRIGRCVEVDTTEDPNAPEESGPDDILFDFVNATTARVTVNGNSYDFPRDRVFCFEAETGLGDDRVEVASSVDVPVTLLGGTGNDTLIGSSGSDSLDGGEGDDSIAGNDGGDTLSGDVGNDSLDGGLGDDSISGGDGDDTLVDGMGNDTLDGGVGADLFLLSPGSDDVLRDGAGSDTVSFARALRGVRFDLGRSAGQRQVVDDARNTVALHGDFENLVGSRFADDLVGDARPNRIDGGVGDDTVDGGGGDRTAQGATSNTDRRAGAGCDGDILLGGSGHDWLDGGRGADSLDGGTGNDVLVGDPTQDSLKGGSGRNQTSRVTKTSAACDGAVRAVVSVAALAFDRDTGHLFVSGDVDGAADDVIAVSATDGGFVAALVNGSAHSSDPASADFDPQLAGATAGSVLSISVEGVDGNDQIAVGDGFAAASGHVMLFGGPGDDRLAGGAGADVLFGGPGNDVLAGGGGDDTLAGNAGNDSLDGGPGGDTTDFSSSAAAVRVNLIKRTARGQGSDVLVAVEHVLGSMFNDQLIGDALANVLWGGDGNDDIRGNDGDDSLDGGAGDDILRGGLGLDELSGSDGVDRFVAVDDVDLVVNDLLDQPLRRGRRR